MNRIRPNLPRDAFPTMSQAGNDSGVIHSLKAVKAVGVERAKASGHAVVEAPIGRYKRVITAPLQSRTDRIKATGTALEPDAGVRTTELCPCRADNRLGWGIGFTPRRVPPLCDTGANARHDGFRRPCVR